MTRVILLMILIVVWDVCLPVVCKECGSLDIRNSVHRFEILRNCTKINGSLQVLLLDIPPGYNQSFPELVEIAHYVMFFRVTGLRSLGDLFPNLAIIRGHELFLNYALIIYEMKDLEEVGLYSLARFRRGSARIDKNPNLCYLNTINWEQIGGSHHFISANRNVSECPNKCPQHCSTKNCWNQEHCQLVLSKHCHKECAKGCSGPGSDQCDFCENLEDNGECVSKCPASTYHLVGSNKCITKEECFKRYRSDDEWWMFNGECLNKCPPKYERVSAEEGNCKHCGSACPKVCQSANVISLSAVQSLQECTYINGSLYIRINGPSNIEEELEENLGRIEEITGFLKIYRSYSIKSLNFLKNLKVIHGQTLDSKYYSVVIHENQNLQTLWDWKNIGHKLKILAGTFSFHYNPKLCMSEIEKMRDITQLKDNYTQLDVSPHSNGDKVPCKYENISAAVVWRSTDTVTLEWKVNAEQKTKTFIGYLIYYIEASSKNVSLFYGDACDEEKWKTAFIPSEETKLSTLQKNITHLKPFTRYVFYLSTNYNIESGGLSPLQSFITLSGDPDNPTDLRARPEGSDSIVLTWKAPQTINGVLSHYIIIAYPQRDNGSLIDQRNYCIYPRVPQPRLEPTTTKPPPPSNTSCCVKKPTVSIPKKEVFEEICTDLDKYTIKHKDKSKSCGNYAYGIVQESLTHQKRSRSDDIIKIVSANDTSATISGLVHFTTYVFLIRACNENRSQEHQCSSVMMHFQRTGRKESADRINDLTVTVTEAHNVELFWREPEAPNAAVVSYNIEYRSEGSDSHKSVPYCVTRLEHVQANYKYRFTNFVPDSYCVRVRAVSLAGNGPFTDCKRFVISTTSQTSIVVPIVSAVVCATLVFVALLLYLRYRQQRHLDNIHLIARVNPEYAGYIEDDWEIDRSHIEVHEELGQGTFGTVFSGVLKNKNVACAVKTVHDNATMHDKMEFLNEASVMKSFNDAHHVIRLLGVVSRGIRPLVVMELMARGDLKTYLRSTRESSTNLTCSEMYRMAAEISDGMAYLSAKKFVHRDLAARNCMVASDRTVKIGDFGMTRDVYETDYYRKETRGLLPVRWMAPESLADGVFTSDSDIWSYGIVLWEIATLAEQPYQGLSNEQVLQFVVSKGVLERPLQCPDILYDVMEVCWKWRPSDRPSFMEIVEKLETNVGQDFRLVSFCHSRDGEELRLHRYEVKRVRANPAVPFHNLHRVAPPVRWSKGSERLYSYDDVPSTSADAAGYSSVPFIPKTK